MKKLVMIILVGSIGGCAGMDDFLFDSDEPAWALAGPPPCGMPVQGPTLAAFPQPPHGARSASLPVIQQTQEPALLPGR